MPRPADAPSPPASPADALRAPGPGRFVWTVVCAAAVVGALFLLPSAGRRGIVLLVVAAPPLLALLAMRRYHLLLFLVLVTPVWSPSVNVLFANMYLHQALLLVATLSLGMIHLLFAADTKRVREGWRLLFPVLALPTGVSLLLSFGVAPDARLAVKHALYISVLFCSYYVAANTLITWARIRRFLQFFCGGGVLAALVALALGPARGGEPHTSLFQHANAFGHYLCIVLSFWVALRVAGGRVFRAAGVDTLCIGLGLAVLLLTRSRAAWLGMLAAFGGILLLDRRVRPKLILGGLAVTVLGLALELQHLLVGGIAAKGFSGVTYRVRKMELAWSMFRESPLVGGGPGAFEYTARHHPERWLHTHATLESMYPYVLANYGAIGVLAFLATLGICVGVWRGLPRRRGHPARTVGLAVVAAGIGLLAAQVGENTIFHPKINWTIGMLLGLLRVLRHPSLREERPDAGGGAWAAAEA